MVMVFAICLCQYAYSQRSVAVMKEVSEQQLTAKEQEYASHVLKNRFLLKHWYAEFAFDPNGTELEISLPESLPLELLRERKTEPSSGLISWSGRSADGISSASLVWHNGMITGIVTVNSRLSLQRKEVLPLK
jgi:hypothetical protein